MIKLLSITKLGHKSNNPITRSFTVAPICKNDAKSRWLSY